MAECGRGWAYRCQTATGERCTCKCGGVNHGVHADAPVGLPGIARPRRRLHRSAYGRALAIKPPKFVLRDCSVCNGLCWPCEFSGAMCGECALVLQERAAGEATAALARLGQKSPPQGGVVEAI